MNNQLLGGYIAGDAILCNKALKANDQKIKS